VGMRGGSETLIKTGFQDLNFLNLIF
jgi:hypothetical protein